MGVRISLALAAALAAPPATASREAGAVYGLSIAGIPIGEARLSAVVADGRYRIEGSADVGFLFWGGEGVAVAEGAAAEGRLRPDRYSLRYEGVTRPGAVEIAFDGGRAVDWRREPPIPEKYREGRVDIGPEALSGVLDPLSALLIPAGHDAPADAVCGRVLPVFSGYTRFDLELVRAEALDGDAVVCETRYRPVAGHRRDSEGVKRLSKPGAFSVRLAPVADGLWGPDRVAMETRFGLFELKRRR